MKSALRFFVPNAGNDTGIRPNVFGRLTVRCSLKIELCDKLEPLQDHPVSWVGLGEF